MIDLGLLYTSWAKSHGGIFHNQHRYLPQLLEMYGIIDCKPLSYPMDLQSQLSHEEHSPFLKIAQRMTLIGSLIHLSNTSPDLSYSVSVPCQVHWQAAICVLQNFVGTTNYGLSFNGGIKSLVTRTLIGQEMLKQDNLHLAIVLYLAHFLFLGIPRNQKKSISLRKQTLRAHRDICCEL